MRPIFTTIGKIKGYSHYWMQQSPTESKPAFRYVWTRLLSCFSTFLFSSAISDTCIVPLPPFGRKGEAKDGRNSKFCVLDTCPQTPLHLFLLEPSRKKSYQKFQGKYYMALQLVHFSVLQSKDTAYLFHSTLSSSILLHNPASSQAFVLINSLNDS